MAARGFRIGIAIVAVLASVPALAETAASSLYETVTIVTGQREETRIPGIRRCFVDALQKVSGDQTLVADPMVAKLADEAASYVVGYRYQDRLWKRPIHDEQGTRDRPHDLTVDFEPTKIDATLASLGRKPWTDARPHVVAFVAVEQGPATYVTTTDGSQGYGQADAFADASARAGVPVTVPTQRILETARLGHDAVAVADPATLDTVAEAAGGSLALVGTMRFSDADLGWIVDWRVVWQGTLYRWRVSGVSFDAAFLNGLRGVAQIASGHGRPS